MTHTEKQIADYEAAIRVMETLPEVSDYVPAGNPKDIRYGRVDQRNADLQELRRRLAVMKQWRPGQRWQSRRIDIQPTPEWNNNMFDPTWLWKQEDYRPAPSPAKPSVVWRRDIPSTIMPYEYKIYCFNNGGSDRWYEALAIGDDGFVLAGHVCSHPSFMPHDLGITSTWKHNYYNAHFGEGNWELEWVENPDTHEGLAAAIKLADAKTPEEHKANAEKLDLMPKVELTIAAS